MRKPVEVNSSLQRMIKLVMRVQLGLTIVLGLLSLFLGVSLINYNGRMLAVKLTIMMLVIQCACSLFIH